LPPEEGRPLIKSADRAGLDMILFLAPTSTGARVKFITSIAKGFIYYVSLTGTTGIRKKLSADIIKNVKMIKKNTLKPVCVGFGISHPGHVRKISHFSDGVIVGSAIVKKIKENIGKKDLVRRVVQFTEWLKSGQ
ncbi:MAG: tryptophan synthase subunit alpha, partial [Candidatus Omnitrophica bacterium]|nr:tryptophan synthase subunit alpha [Candidatus Omnitrophota bacterium]